MISRRNKLIVFTGLFIFVMVLSFTLQAASPQSEPVGDPRAIRGGQLNLQTSEFPKSFNAFVNSAIDAAEVFSLVYDTLMDLNYNTLEYQPLIAKSIDTSPDKKTFTVNIDPRAKWADGKPITSEDILFTFDTIMNPKNLTSVQRMFYSRFSRPEIIDKYTIKFTAKTVHYNNFIAVVDFNVLPKHLFQGKDFNKAFNMSLPPGSGPYVLSEVKEGRYFVLKRRKNYWADQLPSLRGMYNFDRIKYKVIRDENVAFESFKKGDFDFYKVAEGKRWVTETNSEKFKKNWIVKQKIFNYSPRGFYGLAFNMRKPLFKELKARQAIFLLFDRKTILEKLEYNEFQPFSSYWPSLYGFKSANYPVDYDPAKAKQLLREAGYTRLDQEGYLINDHNERLEFTLSYAAEIYEKHFTLFADTLKQAGVKMNLELLSWATLIKKMDEYKFDMVSIGWGGTLFGEPEQLWHSKHAEEIGGSNLPGYKNPEVDQLIDSMPQIFDANERNEITKKIDSIIYRDVPYVLMWGSNCSRILYKNMFGMPKTVFPKYTRAEDGIISYWWYDPVKVKKYQEAIKKNKALPSVLEKIYFDDVSKK